MISLKVENELSCAITLFIGWRVFSFPRKALPVPGKCDRLGWVGDSRMRLQHFILRDGRALHSSSEPSKEKKIVSDSPTWRKFKNALGMLSLQHAKSESFRDHRRDEFHELPNMLVVHFAFEARPALNFHWLHYANQISASHPLHDKQFASTAPDT